MTASHRGHWAQWGALIVRPTRERLGLSRRELACKAEISVSRIIRLEGGRIQWRPQARFLHALCNALNLPVPGDGGLYLSLDGHCADALGTLVGTALYEFARRRRDAGRFALMIHLPRDARALRCATAAVLAERDCAIDLLGLLCPDLDTTELAAPPAQTSRQRQTAVRSRPLISRHPTRTHG